MLLLPLLHPHRGGLLRRLLLPQEHPQPPGPLIPADSDGTLTRMESAPIRVDGGRRRRRRKRRRRPPPRRAGALCRAATVKKMKHVWWSRRGHGEVATWSRDYGVARGGCAGRASRCAKRGADSARRHGAGGAMAGPGYRADPSEARILSRRGQSPWVPARGNGARLCRTADCPDTAGQAAGRRPPTHARGKSRPATSESSTVAAAARPP